MRTAGQALKYLDLGQFVPIANRIGIEFFEQPTAQIYWIMLYLKLKDLNRSTLTLCQYTSVKNTYINDYTAGGGNKPTLMYIYI